MEAMLSFFITFHNREMIKSSRVPLNVFTKDFPNTSSESLAQLLRTKVPPDNLNLK